MKLKLLSFILSLVVMIASAPNLHAQSKCYEQEIVKYQELDIEKKIALTVLPFLAVEQLIKKTDPASSDFDEECSNIEPFQRIENVYIQNLKSIENFIEQSCKQAESSVNIYCHYSYYLKMFLEAKSYLSKNSTDIDGTIKMKQDNIPENFYNDLIAVNWHFDFFSTKEKHEVIVSNILAEEFSSRAIELILKKLRVDLDKMYHSQSLEYRRGRLQFLESYSRYRDPILWMLDIALSNSCLKNEISCLKEKKDFLIALYFKADVNGIWSQISNYKEMIRNYSPRPWPEAAQLKEIYDLSNFISGIRSLSENQIAKLATEKKSALDISGAKNYIKKVMELTERSMGLNNHEKIGLYRQAVALDKYIEMANRLKALAKKENTVVSDGESENLTPIDMESYTHIKNKFIFKLSNLNNFFFEMNSRLLSEGAENEKSN